MISVSSASKGDILIEPIELLIELLIRFFGKALSRTDPADPLEQWGWLQWLWVGVFLALASLIIWAMVRHARRKHAKTS